jgi:hypothetical protein
MAETTAAVSLNDFHKLVKAIKKGDVPAAGLLGALVNAIQVAIETATDQEVTVNVGSISEDVDAAFLATPAKASGNVSVTFKIHR